jgi:hypothetical protein
MTTGSAYRHDRSGSARSRPAGRADGRADNLSAGEPPRRQADRVAGWWLDDFIAAYEAEHGEITEAEMEKPPVAPFPSRRGTGGRSEADRLLGGPPRCVTIVLDAGAPSPSSEATGR